MKEHGKDVHSELEPKELGSNLRKQFDRWGIENFVLDFDGTLVNTGLVFYQAMVDACGLLLYGQDWHQARLISTSPKIKKALALKEKMDEIIWQLRPEYGVNPQIMTTAVLLTANLMEKVAGQKLALDRTELAQERIERIYDRDIPPLFPGALETIDLINASGKKTILATHAAEEWTWLKRCRTGLTGRFAQVIHFSTKELKSSQWQGQLSRFGLDPRATLFIGNDQKADILVPVKLGGRAVWITNNQTKSYSIEPEPAFLVDETLFQEKVMVLAQIGDLVPALLAKKNWSV